MTARKHDPQYLPLCIATAMIINLRTPVVALDMPLARAPMNRHD